MVLILDGKVAHKRSFGIQKNQICGYSRSYQMPVTDQIKWIAPYVRTYF